MDLNVKAFGAVADMAASEAHPNADCRQQQGDKIWEVAAEVPDEWSATLT
jgi:hypothetical protein